MNDELMRIQRYLLFSPPDDGGGATLSIEEMTNKKLSGADDSESNPESDANDGTPPASAESGQEEPPRKSIQDELDGEEDTGSEEPEFERDEPASKSASSSEGDEGEPGDQTDFYYDPEKHVEGEPAHSNKFKTREQAEYAAIAKAELLSEAIEKMKEDGIGTGAIKLPKALQGDINSLDQMTNLEVIHAMDDNELRTFLNESDATRQRFDQKRERVQQEKQAREATTKYEQKQVELYDELKKVMSVDEIEANLNKLGDAETASQFIESKVTEKIKSELAEERQELEDWIDKVDSGDINLSIKEFDKQKQERVNSIERKAQELADEYSGATQTLNELFELHEQVENNKQLTPQERAQKVGDAFMEFQADRQGEMAILADDPTAKAELVAAKKFALQNADTFNGLMDPRDWVKAMDAWEEHKARIRANNQRKQLESESKKKTGGKPGVDLDGDDDVPRPGNQEELRKGMDTDGGVLSENKRRLDKLAQLTNARI